MLLLDSICGCFSRHFGSVQNVKIFRLLLKISVDWITQKSDSVFAVVVIRRTNQVINNLDISSVAWSSSIISHPHWYTHSQDVLIPICMSVLSISCSGSSSVVYEAMLIRGYCWLKTIFQYPSVEVPTGTCAEFLASSESPLELYLISNAQTTSDTVNRYTGL